MSSARDCALALAAAGMKVFPLHNIEPTGECSCGPSCKPGNRGKHPRAAGWQAQATSDAATIERWFQTTPSMNYGVATGAASGIWVLDIDPDKGGFDSMLELAANECVPPSTLEVATGSGGTHLYLRHIEGFGNRSGILPGIDGRGDGGYVVGPGCRNHRGAYTVAVDAPVAAMPDWLVAELRSPAGAAARDGRSWEPLAMSATELAGARAEAAAAARALPPGREGDGGGAALLKLCRDLYRGWGLPDDELTRAIVDEYCARCDPPWADEREIEHKIEQGMDGAQDPQGRGVGYLLMERRMAAAFVAAADAPLEVERNTKGLRVVRVRTKEGEVVEEAVAAMAERNGVYTRCDQLVAVFPGELPGDRRRVLNLPKASVRALIAQCCDLIKYDARSEDWVPSHPPTWLVEAIFARCHWPDVPPLTDFVDAPCLRADGTLVDQPGYDKASMVYYAPSFEALPVPEAPTKEEAAEAAAELLDLVCDFPFAGPEHRSAWLAALLTQFCRPAVRGSIPMVMIDGNSRGAGKTLLADVISHIAIGRSANKTPPTKDPEELRKQFSSAVLAGDTMLCLDNVVGEVGGPALDAALTNDGRWSDRILGGNTRVDKVVRMTVFATGNNLALRDDLVRRLLYVRLDSPDEHPERRGGFRHELPEAASANRAKYVRACLVILRAYYAAGRPSVGLSDWGSYVSWSAAVRAPIVWCGLPDPALARRQLEEEVDEEPGHLELLVEGLAKMQERKPGGWTASDVAVACASFMPDEKNEPLRQAIGMLAFTRQGSAPTGKQIGYVLRKYRNKPISGRMLIKHKMRGHEKIAFWLIAPAKI